MDIYKIMVTGEHEEIAWNIHQEVPIPIDHMLYGRLSNFIDHEIWRSAYWSLYHDWLTNDNQSIYLIRDSINLEMLDALNKFNHKYSDIRLYYWFDVNRDKNPDHIWKKCPASNTDLILLDDAVFQTNLKVSTAAPLIFPG